MNSLPLDLENIILDYKYGMEHKEKFKKTLDIIKDVGYSITNYGELLSERSYIDKHDLEQSILYQYDYDINELSYWRVDMDLDLEHWITIEY